MDTPKSPNKTIVILVVIVLLAVVTTAIVAMNSKKTDTISSTAQITSGASTNSASIASGNYKDGTYSATGSYKTPGGQESIGVKVTLSGGTITDATVTQNASGGEAEEYQSAFLSGYKSQVVGKKINEVSLSRVAGSSLTPNGFNNAIDTIKSDAAA